jgi:hypothetical protein
VDRGAAQAGGVSGGVSGIRSAQGGAIRRERDRDAAAESWDHPVTREDRSDDWRGAGYLAMQKEGVDFSTWVWEMVGGQPIQNEIRKGGPVPATTPLAETMSKELKKRGFKFVGPVIVYAWMQAAGIVNDHAKDCFRRGFCARIRRKV